MPDDMVAQHKNGTLARVRAPVKPENGGNLGNYISKFYGKAGNLKGGFRRVQGGLKIVSNKVLEGRKRPRLHGVSQRLPVLKVAYEKH